MRLVKLSIEEISRNWKLIYSLMKRGIPYSDYVDEASVFKSVLSGILTIWLGVEGATVKGLGAIAVMSDDIEGGINLLIYSIVSNGRITNEEWEEAFKQIEDYARSIGCKEIVGFSDNVRLLQLAERLGFNTKIRMINKVIGGSNG